MSNDIKIIANKQDIVAIADAVRSKTGITNEMTLGGIVNGINGIQVGVDLPELTNPASEDDLLQGKELIDEDGNIVTGTMPTATQATPSITVNSSGLITATATQSAGYVAAGTKSATKQLTTKSATTITPSTLDQVAINSGVYATGAVTVKGDANLVAANIVSGKSIFGVSGTATVGGSGEAAEYSEAEDAMVTHILTKYTNDRVTTIGSYAFYNHENLTSVSFPKVTSIGSYAFYNCSSLTSVSFPVCTSIGNSAFWRCSRLTSVSFPKVTSIGNNAFSYCSSLTSVSFPVCTSIGGYAFACCSRLTSVSFPKVTSIGSDAFYSCSSLTSVSFPVCTSISNSAFKACRTLSSLTLEASTVCTLTNSNAFSSTPYAGYSSYFSGTPYIYVPASLLASYQTATNWTYFSSYFVAI